MKQAYRRAILANPSFLYRRFKHGIKTVDFFWTSIFSSNISGSRPSKIRGTRINTMPKTVGLSMISVRSPLRP